MKKLLFLLLIIPAIAAAQNVYRTPSGKKYHTANCRMIKNKSESITVNEAVQSGLDACKICHPAAVQKFSAAAQASSVAAEKTTSTQCKGRTKKGSRCKHSTKIGNGYCFQHQPQE